MKNCRFVMILSLILTASAINGQINSRVCKFDTTYLAVQTGDTCSFCLYDSTGKLVDGSYYLIDIKDFKKDPILKKRHEIPNVGSAYKVAKICLEKKFGNISKEEPLQLYLIDNMFGLARGQLKPHTFGGVGQVLLRKIDGKVFFVIHEK